MAHRVLAAVLLGLAVPGFAAVVLPLGTPGTLSLIDDEHVEISYDGRDETLLPATFVQTLAAIALAASIPPSPFNPWMVENGLDVLGIPHKDYRSCWPDDGAILLVPTAPIGAVDAALAAASDYYDPARQAREFEAAYWHHLFTSRDQSSSSILGWPGDPAMESLKETIVGSVPFPLNLDSMETYARRGIIPLLQAARGRRTHLLHILHLVSQVHGNRCTHSRRLWDPRPTVGHRGDGTGESRRGLAGGQPGPCAPDGCARSHLARDGRAGGAP